VTRRDGASGEEASIGAVTPRPSTGWKLVILSTLYFVQGLPFGFQATALPTYLRTQGASLTAIGLLGVLATPWSLKALWAPLVDRYGSERIGRRKSWILPMQILLCFTCAGASFIPLPVGLPTLMAMVFLMNLFAATMDIAVDGLAVDLLDADELGHGNSSQVVGYKAGMLTGGGLLVWASGKLGWHGLLLWMAALVAAIFLFTLTWREPPPRQEHAARDAANAHTEGGTGEADATDGGAAGATGATVTSGGAKEPTLGGVLGASLRALRVPGSGWLLLFIGTYKTGEAMVDTMFKPFLIDVGFSPQQLGLWLGTYGMVASVLGSLAGGWAASRLPSIWSALWIASALRVLPMVGEVVLSLSPPTSEAVIAVTSAEHFFGGALTTVVFAFMMSRVDARVGATHYTVLATVEVLGKSPGSWASGKLALLLGYPTLFAIGTAQAAIFLLLLLPLRSVPGVAGGGRPTIA
jgi:MFS transporter, PAT family, beta-lactamase induction signal transducer AmpG